MSKRFLQEADEDEDDLLPLPTPPQQQHRMQNLQQATPSTRGLNTKPPRDTSSSLPKSKKQRFLDDDSDEEEAFLPSQCRSVNNKKVTNVFHGNSVMDSDDVIVNLSQSSNHSNQLRTLRRSKVLEDFFDDDDDEEDLEGGNKDEQEEEDAEFNIGTEDKRQENSSKYDIPASNSKQMTSDLFERMFGEDYRPCFHSEYKQVDNELILAETTEKKLILNKYAARYLIDHQVEGSKWISQRYLEKKGGILGDEMGLGKTIQVAAFLNALYMKSGTAEQDKEWMRMKKRHDAESRYSNDTCKMYCNMLPSLIICPKTLLDNWKRELSTWGYFLVDCLSSDMSEDDVDCMISRALRQQTDLVLISYPQINHFFPRLREVHWNVIIYDEGHILKNPNSLTYERVSMINKAVSRLILTGTPLQNNLGELWALLHLLDKDQYTEKKSFSKEIERPIKLGISSNASREEVKNAKKARAKVDEILSDCLIQRKKNVLKGESALKGKDEIIVLCDLSPLQQDLYEYCLSLPDFENVRYHASPCPCGSQKSRGKCCPEYRYPYNRASLPNFNIDPRAALWREFHPEDKPCNPERRATCPRCILLPCLNMLSKIASHPMLIQSDPKSADLEKQRKAERFISAAFPSGLIERLGGTKRSNRFLTMKSAEVSGKMKTLKEMLAHFLRNGEKSLVFSLRTQVLDVLEAMCIAEGWKFLRLDGQTASKKRQNLVDEFNKDSEMMIFLISSRAGGVGLNLSSASKVIIFDVDWNPVIDMQSQDRAYRIGQLEHVSVYRLVAKGTIEELAYMRQLYKQQFHNVVLPNQQSSEDASSTSKKKKFQRGRFEGVDGEAKMRGELFGVENLFQFSKSSILHTLRKKYEASAVQGSSSSVTTKSTKRNIPSSITNQALENNDVTSMIRNLIEEVQESSSNPSEGSNHGSALALLEELGINLKNAHSLDQMLQDLKEGEEESEASDQESIDGNNDVSTSIMRTSLLKPAGKRSSSKQRQLKIFDPNASAPLQIKLADMSHLTNSKNLAPIFTRIKELKSSRNIANATNLSSEVVDLTDNQGSTTPARNLSQEEVVELDMTPPSQQSPIRNETPQSESSKGGGRKLPHMAGNKTMTASINEKKSTGLYKPSYNK